jgi:CheY-like chemotaxis protein
VSVEPQRTVLVVDDESAVLRFVVDALSADFVTLEAASAAEGLRLFQVHRDAIDLVIIDMMMPGMSGLDLAAELSRLQPDLEILYISGHAESLAMQCITDLRPEVVLLKPFDSSTLVARVQRLLPAEP